jgi:hypothetical protein
MYSDEECRRKTHTPLGYATCQGQKW